MVAGYRAVGSFKCGSMLLFQAESGEICFGYNIWSIGKVIKEVHERFDSRPISLSFGSGWVFLKKEQRFKKKSKEKEKKKIGKKGEKNFQLFSEFENKFVFLEFGGWEPKFMFLSCFILFGFSIFILFWDLGFK